MYKIAPIAAASKAPTKTAAAEISLAKRAPSLIFVPTHKSTVCSIAEFNSSEIITTAMTSSITTISKGENPNQTAKAMALIAAAQWILRFRWRRIAHQSPVNAA
jgi:lysozyme family protein